MTHQNTQGYEGRVRRLLEKTASKEITLCLIRNEESSTKNLHYFSGFTGTSGFFAITDRKQQIGTDSRYWIQAAEQSPFELVQETKDNAQTLLKTICSKHKTIGYEAATTSVRSFQILQNQLGDKIEWIPIDPLIEELRCVKDDIEIQIMKEAQRISAEAFMEWLNEVRPGRTEKFLAAHLEYLMKTKGADDAAFSSIVASGYRSALPHGRASNKILEPGDIIVIDYGCSVDGYCSDITRTIALGPIDSLKEEVYGIVAQAQLEALKSAKAGMTGKELDFVARTIIQKAGYGDHFGHGLGHGLGMQVHEAPSVSLRNEKPLPAGSVVTIEPGIYLEGSFGVRIEDDIVLLNDGMLNLTTLSKELLVLS
jgi:Xaa-Pro aminopeptidase